MKKYLWLIAVLALAVSFSVHEVCAQETADPIEVVSGKLNWTQCPMVFPWNGEVFEEEVVFLTGFDAPEKAAVSHDPLDKINLDSVPKVLIREQGKEAAYIDQIRLKVNLKKGKSKYLKPVEASRDLKKLKKADGKAVVVTEGQELIVEFKPLKKKWLPKVTMVELEAKGYYLKDGIAPQE